MSMIIGNWSRVREGNKKDIKPDKVFDIGFKFPRLHIGGAGMRR